MEPVLVVPVAASPRVSRTVATKEALARLRGIPDNAELAERIPVELCRAGFGRVLYSVIQKNIWMVRSGSTTGDARLISALLEVGRAHPVRLCPPLPESDMVQSKTAILVHQPQSDPRVNSPLVAVVKPNVYVAAPVYVWQTPVGLLHADAPDDEAGDVGPDDRDVLGIFAEGLGAIMERNIALDSMQNIRNSAYEHRRRVAALTEFVTDDLSMGTPSPASAQSAVDDVLGQLTRRELQVLNLLTAGKTNAQIGGRLFISEGTVKSHLRQVMTKLGAANRTEAVARFRQLGGVFPTSDTQT